jgi:chaperonin cofactor prefoldin
MNNTNNELNIVLTQDKLLEILLHAATREDIAKLDTKLEGRIDRLDTRMDRLDTRIDRLDTKIDKVMYGIVLAILMPITIQVLPHFVHFS